MSYIRDRPVLLAVTLCLSPDLSVSLSLLLHSLSKVVAQADSKLTALDDDLELLILPPLPPGYWYSRCESQLPFYMVLGIKAQNVVDTRQALYQL